MGAAWMHGACARKHWCSTGTAAVRAEGHWPSCPGCCHQCSRCWQVSESAYCAAGTRSTSKTGDHSHRLVYICTTAWLYSVILPTAWLFSVILPTAWLFSVILPTAWLYSVILPTAWLYSVILPTAWLYSVILPTAWLFSVILQGTWVDRAFLLPLL